MLDYGKSANKCVIVAYLGVDLITCHLFELKIGRDAGQRLHDIFFELCRRASRDKGGSVRGKTRIMWNCI